MNSLHGTKIAPECFDKLKELQLRNLHRYIVYKLDLSTLSITVEKTAPIDAPHEAIAAELPTNEPRFVVFNFSYQTANDGQRDKTVFALWSPSGSALRARTIYAAANCPFRTSLGSISFEMQGGHTEDFAKEALVERCVKMYR